MTEHVIFVVDPTERLGVTIARCGEQLRGVVADTDAQGRQLLGVADDLDALGWHLFADRFSPRAPGGVELAPIATLFGDWRPLIDRLASTVGSRLERQIPPGAPDALRQVQRSALWSVRPDACPLYRTVERTLGRPDCTLDEVEFEAYVGLVRATLADPLERWAALGPTATRAGLLSTHEDVPGQAGRPERGL